MITALIIDDEDHNRSVLRTLLAAYCPEVKIVDEAEDSESAFQKITEHKPQLIFLDIQMPKKSGFELLKRFDKINFEVIFVTAFNKYAIKAFEFNALGYILKPIDIAKLKKAVTKAIERIEANKPDDLMLHFIRTLSDQNELVHKFSVHHNGKVVFVNVSEISHIESSEGHTTLNLLDNTHFYSSKDLQQFEQVLEHSNEFIRLNKSVIINMHFIKSYSKGEICIVDMKNGKSFEVSRRRKAEILRKLKSY